MDREPLKNPWLPSRFANLIYSFKIVGIAPLLVILLLVIPAIILAQLGVPEDARLEFVVYFLEVGIPALIAISAVFVIAPESDVCLELIMTYRKPLLAIRSARLFVLFLQTGTVLVLGSIALIKSDQNLTDFKLLQALLTWVSPTTFLVGVGLAGTLFGGRGAYGIASIFVVFGINISILLLQRLYGVPIIESLALQSIYIFLTSMSLQLQVDHIWHTNRLVLILLGLVGTCIALWFAPEDERVLGVSRPSRRLIKSLE